MLKRHVNTIVLIFLAILIAGCSSSATVTPVSPTATAASPTTTPELPTVEPSPAATPVLEPTATTPPTIAPTSAATDDQAINAEKDSTAVVFAKSRQSLDNSRPFGVAIADIDLDNDNDIFFPNYIGPSKLWLNDGNGVFVDSRQRFSTSETHDVAIQDLNGDTWPDIFLLAHATPSKVYFNDGSGGFTDSQQNIGSTGDAPNKIVLGDVDNDGDIDAFIAYSRVPTRLWLNDGNGFFTITDTEFGDRGRSYGLALTDFDGDSFSDLFLSMNDQPDQVWMNDGSGNFVNSGQTLGSPTGDDSVDSRDVDGDGDDDVVVVNNVEGIKVWLNENNTGVFVEAGPYFGAGARNGRLFDADLDGDFDLITTHLENGSELWLNDGSGSFTSLGQLFGSGRVLSIACGKLDADDDYDVVLGKLEGAGGNAVYFNESVSTVAISTDTDASNTWFKTYGGNRDDVCDDALLADDGGYFLVGTTNLQFEPEMQGDVYLIRTDSAGEVLWEKVYEREGYQGGQTIFETNDGELMISGVASSSDTNGMDVYLMKLDQDGNELWSKTFGGPLDEVAAARPMADGGYILVGNIVDPDDFVADPGSAGYGGFEGRSNIYLAKLDAGGNELWSHAYGGENNVLATGGVQTPDGGGLILATILYFPESGDDVWLLKVDRDGNEVWSRIWEEGSISARDFIQTADGNYLITGAYSPSGEIGSNEDFLFIKIDPKGNELWTSTFGDPDMIDYGMVLAETMDGGYVAAGERVKDLYTWNADIALVKIDKNGQLLWEQIIETDAHCMFGTILQHPDGGYVIAGSTFNGRTFDIFMIKTDAEGNVE